MTFSARIRSELCKIPLNNPELALAECCGMVLFANATRSDKIKITTENSEVARRASWLFKGLFGFDFDKKIVPASAVKKYNLILENPERLSVVFDALGISSDNDVSMRLNAAIVENDSARAAFCRGAFLTGGSVTDPNSSYHLELATSHKALSLEVVSLLLELELPAKTAMRKSNYIIYFKESESIEDFLTRIGAPLCALEFMQAKLYKNVRNSVNRKVNCEFANQAKTADAAAIQLSSIKTIIKHSGIESLPAKLRDAAEMRLQNPDMSLSELAALTCGQISKSGLNHRFSKLIALADEIGDERTNKQK